MRKAPKRQAPFSGRTTEGLTTRRGRRGRHLRDPCSVFLSLPPAARASRAASSRRRRSRARRACLFSSSSSPERSSSGSSGLLTSRGTRGARSPLAGPSCLPRGPGRGNLCPPVGKLSMVRCGSCIPGGSRGPAPLSDGSPSGSPRPPRPRICKPEALLLALTVLTHAALRHCKPQRIQILHGVRICMNLTDLQKH